MRAASSRVRACSPGFVPGAALPAQSRYRAAVQVFYRLHQCLPGRLDQSWRPSMVLGFPSVTAINCAKMQFQMTRASSDQQLGFVVRSASDVLNLKAT